jgi:1-acyl-sn-glycerol-3-phosphate acyltransferase
MCNHFGFLDSFFAYYVCLKLIDKQQPITGIYNMSLKKQMEKKWWLRHYGSFSVDPGKRSVSESLDFAAQILNEPGNILIYYPQGNLESSHIRHIEFKDGVYEIMQRLKGNCQLIWSSTLTEYFESVKPSAYINLVDCGTNADFDFEGLKEKVNTFHLAAMKKNVRFTNEG